MKHQCKRYFYHKTDDGFIQVTRVSNRYQFCQFFGGDSVPVVKYGTKKAMVNLAINAMQDYAMS